VEMIILKKDDSLMDMIEKLEEETEEVRHAIRCESESRVIEEVLDNIQVGIGILDYLSRRGHDIATFLDKHNRKLLDRHWRYSGVIHINVIGERDEMVE
jgi:NTP pyrophosphatase (non-canonical NTP hydrolase)